MSIYYFIYCATNELNGKRYVGFTNNFARRKAKHLSDAFHPSCSNYDCLFYRAIRKYGIGAFTWEIIYMSRDGDDTMRRMEPHFIKEYQSFGARGYNSTIGGEGTFGYKHTEAAKATLSAKKKGIAVGPFTDEHRSNLSINKKRFWSTNKSDIGDRSAKKFKLTTVTGQVLIITNLRKYMRDNGLISTGFYNLKTGKVKRYKDFVACESIS